MGCSTRFHRRTGEADLALDDAVDLFRQAGRDDIAERIATDLIGRNVLEGRWTFQVIEEYDAGYYATFKEHERSVRESLTPRAYAPPRGGHEGGAAHARSPPPRGTPD